MTNLLLGISSVVFVFMVLNRVPLFGPTSDQIVRWGGNFGPLTLGTQPWRLLTNIFVHIGIVHLIANMWALFVLGRLAEPLYGRITFLGVYSITGIAGSLASLMWNPMGVSAGASGALFGISAALIATLYVGKLPLPRESVKPVLVTLVVWAALQLGYGLWKSGVDNAAHVGGLVAGFALGYPLGHHLGPSTLARHSRRRIFAVSLAILGTLCFAVWRANAYVIQVERAHSLLNQNKPDEAIPLLQAVAQRKPGNVYVHVLLAESFQRVNDFSRAEGELKQALQIAPANSGTWRNLGALYARAQRWDDSANAYSKAASLTKDNAISWFDAGIAFRQADRPKQAAESFHKSVAANPGFGEAWFQLGISLLNLKQNNEAISALQQATRLLPNNPDAHLWLGNALLAAGQEEASKAEFLRAFQLRAFQQRVSQERQKQQQQRQSGPVVPR